MAVLQVLMVCVLAVAAEQVYGQVLLGTTTRSWDCCKPACSVKDNISKLLLGPVEVCDLVGNALLDVNPLSGCSGGKAYACAKQQPIALNFTHAIAFASANVPGVGLTDLCCSCYKLTFPQEPLLGQRQLIVQVTNTVDTLAPGQFDIQIPGAGIFNGLFNGCSTQFASTVNWSIGSIFSCFTLPSILQPGCFFRFSWFANVVDPVVQYQRVACPTEIVALSGCQRSDEPLALLL